MKNYYFLFVLSLFGTIKSYSQNLVPNHSFEEYNYCPSYGYFTFYDSFDQTFNDWSVPLFHLGSTDYFNACNALFPRVWLGYQNAQDGQGYIGLNGYLVGSGGTVIADYREYAMTKLISTLEKDISYTLSMWVSLADDCESAINGIGMALLSDTQMQSFPTQRTQTFVNGIPPALTAKQVISDKVNWVQLKTEYIAKGDEKYVLLGNLLSNAQTVEISNQIYNRQAYYYIDNIIIMKTSEYIASNQEIEKNFFSIYPNPATDIINIESENEVIKSIEINDVNGKSIPLNNINNQTIDISSLANAIYFLKIKSNTGEEVHKVIKK